MALPLSLGQKLFVVVRRRMWPFSFNEDARRADRSRRPLYLLCPPLCSCRRPPAAALNPAAAVDIPERVKRRGAPFPLFMSLAVGSNRGPLGSFGLRTEHMEP